MSSVDKLTRRLGTLAWLLRGYRVPWCVPAWGLAEARATAAGFFLGRMTRGPRPEQFAAEVARTLGLRFGVPVNRGRTAVELGLRAMGIGPGDDVVLPAYVCGTLLDGVLAAGAHPVFMDVAPDLNPTAETTAAAITPRTRCVIVPHLFGRAAPVDEIEAMLAGRGIRLMDDAAQSFGARRNGRMIGSFGDVGIVAIGAGKSLAGPAGGVLVTNDPEVHARAKALADSLPVESYGSVARRLTEYWLWRRWRRFTFAIMVVWERLARPVAAPHVAARMANVDAAIGLAQLRRLEANAARRRSNADALARALGDAARWSITDRSADGTQVKFTLVVPPEGPTATEVMIALARAGIETQRGYAPCVPPDGERTALPETDAIWQRVVCLPTETTLRDARTLASFAAARPSTAQASAR